MNSILHISCSARAEGSHSARLAAQIVSRLVAQYPQAEVRLRDLGRASIPHPDSDYAYSLAGATREGATGSLAHSDELIAELETADTIVIGTPMHNYTVPSSLKAWIDHVLRIGRTFMPAPEGKRGLLHDRPVYIAVASGGLYLGEQARQPDFLTPYLQAALATIGLRTLHFFALQGTVRSDDAVAAEWRHATALLDAQWPPPPVAIAA
ncbi:MAG: hypothetical protein EOP81_14320 [Variovorax sp.]|nr:MAG: hypothetical protein EOP81_14320 [Variovorax sp.]